MSDDPAGDTPDPALPEQHFFVPGRDPGLSLLARPDWLLRPVPGARVRQYACSDFPEIQALLDEGLDRRWEVGPPAVFEINSLPVMAEPVKFQGGSARIGGKYLLNGASGDRIYARYLKLNPGMRPFRRANRFFAAAKAETRLDLPVIEPPADLAVGIECRNTRNYYHFMTESLPQLVHFGDPRWHEVTFHCRSGEGAETGFAPAFVQAIFPDLADRVHFREGMAKHDRAALALNARHLLYMNGDPLLTGPVAPAAADPAFAHLTSHPRRRNMVLESSFDTALGQIRDRALAALPAGLVERFPRRIFVSRDNRAGGINRRPMEGEEALFAALRAEGFERVYFEHLTPFEQIAAIRAADVIVSMHGAFFANMMFARPDTHVIELGTIQIQRHRWGDFLGNAHAAGCRYSTVFVDAAEPDPTRIRPISTGMSGVRVGARAIAMITELALSSA